MDGNPYVGPRPLEERERLYGRDSEVRRLFYLLTAERIVLLHSPSGAGKSSLIHAALIPRLRNEGFSVLPPARVGKERPPDLPGANRFLISTILSLEEGLPAAQQRPLTTLAGRSLDTHLAERPGAADEDGSEVLIFDQFEEILTIDPFDRPTREEFFAQLGEALRDRRRWALFAMREEHVGPLEPYLRPLPTRLSNRFALGLLSPAGTIEAIRGPVNDSNSGVTFSDEAATKLADDLRRVSVQLPSGATETILGDVIEPVQLQVVCRRLWDRLPQGSTTILTQDIQSAGDVDSALQDYYADSVAAAVRTVAVSERAVRDWCEQQLITANGLRGQVVQQAGSSEGLTNAAIDVLINGHLVRAEQRRGVLWFELTHDRMIAPIRDSNAAWRAANLSLLQRQAALWADQGRPKSLLIGADTLRKAEEWAESYDGELNQEEVAFLAACREARTRERQIRLTIALILGIILAATLIISFLYLQATNEARNAQVRQFAAQALVDRGLAPRRSLLIAIESLDAAHADDPAKPAAQESLYEALAATGGTPLRGHTGGLRAVAFSPDGALIATAGDDASIWLWRTDAPELPLATLRGHSERITDLAFSRDSATLASASIDASVRLWRISAPDQPPTTLKGDPLGLTHLAFSPDGAWLAAVGIQGGARLWSVAEPTRAPALLGPQGQRMFALAFSPEGRYLATGGDDMVIRIWRTASPKQAAIELSGHDKPLTALAFSPDGATLASGSNDATARLWRIASPKSEPTILSGHTKPVVALAFSPDGATLATASLDSTARLWTIGASVAPVVLSGHDKALTALAFSPDGATLATASEDASARLWTIGASVAPVVLSGHDKALTALAFSPDGATLATASEDASARLWRLASPMATPTMLREIGNVSGLAFSPDDKQLVTASNKEDLQGIIHLWDTGSPASAPIRLGGDPVLVPTLALSPDGSLIAAASWDGQVRLWRRDQPTAAPAILAGDGTPFFAIAFSPDGRYLAAGGSQAWLWPVSSPDKPQTLGGHEQSVTTISFSPDGKQIATASKDGKIRVWAIDNLGATPTVLDAGKSGLNVLSFSPNGRLLAAGADDGEVYSWQVDKLATGPQALPGHQGAVVALAFSPDGRYLASGGYDMTVRLWRTENLQADPAVLRGHTQAIHALDFSPDSQRLVTAGEDGTAQIWQTAAPERNPVVLRGLDQIVSAVAFSHNGQILAIGSADGTARLWPTTLEQLRDSACATAGRNLTLDEWRRYLGGDTTSYRKTCPDIPRDQSWYLDLLGRGEIDEAIRDYKEDQAGDQTLAPPAAWLVHSAAALIRQGATSEAINSYAAGLRMDPQLDRAEASSLNELCKYSTLKIAAQVLDACNRAITMVPENGNFHYNRGVVRAMLNDRAGAIEDLEQFIAWAPGHLNADIVEGRAQELIDALRAGRNPFLDK